MAQPFRFMAMFEAFAKALVYALEAYALLGLVFGGIFVTEGVQKLDSEARGSSLGFRLLILPGVAAFWPMLLVRWVRRVPEPPIEKNPHRISS